MPSRGLPQALGWVTGLVSVLLVGLTLYTAYFGVCPMACSAAGICSWCLCWSMPRR